MKRIRTALGRAALVLLLAVPAVPAPSVPAMAADLIASAGWKAEIDRTRPTRPRLVITARLHLPTPGYKARLRLAAMLKSFPPVPIYDLVLTAPTNPVAQVLTWMDFRYVEPIAGPVYRRVIIRYRGKTIARLKVAGAGN
jgi:hypothetical protein